MMLKETKDVNDIHAVLKHPVIYDAITSDNSPCSKHFLAPITDEYRYVLGSVNGDIIGVMVYHEYKDGEECHVQVLPEYRKKYAVEFGDKALRFRDKSKPLYAEIPDIYKNVLSFAVKNDFEVIKQEDLGYKKNGVEYPVNILKYKGV